MYEIANKCNKHNLQSFAKILIPRILISRVVSLWMPRETFTKRGEKLSSKFPKRTASSQHCENTVQKQDHLSSLSTRPLKQFQHSQKIHPPSESISMNQS